MIFIVVIARSEATKQSRTSPKTGLLRSARNDERDVAYEKGQPMPTKYPNGMRLTQWRRTPFRKRHRLLAFAINNALGHWRSCADRRCRRARGCQDHACYWRRLEQMTYEEQMRMREAAAPLAKLLWIGCIKGSEGRPRF
jgi:hypothetical protein